MAEQEHVDVVFDDDDYDAPGDTESALKPIPIRVAAAQLQADAAAAPILSRTGRPVRAASRKRAHPEHAADDSDHHDSDDDSDDSDDDDDDDSDDDDGDDNNDNDQGNASDASYSDSGGAAPKRRAVGGGRRARDAPAPTGTKRRGRKRSSGMPVDIRAERAAQRLDTKLNEVLQNVAVVEGDSIRKLKHLLGRDQLLVNWEAMRRRVALTLVRMEMEGAGPDVLQIMVWALQQRLVNVLEKLHKLSLHRQDRFDRYGAASERLLRVPTRDVRAELIVLNRVEAEHVARFNEAERQIKERALHAQDDAVMDADERERMLQDLQRERERERRRLEAAQQAEVAMQAMGQRRTAYHAAAAKAAQEKAAEAAARAKREGKKSGADGEKSDGRNVTMRDLRHYVEQFDPYLRRRGMFIGH